ncbi:hypothetical protein [Salinibacter ruber]|uniref:hypothetical protein n=1 Tax=Salinibacter ruber TaxID=146919 RepID=UPI0020738D17|nr:hypothetical protein [Salinibacter ruber]MCS3631035.1 putative nucleic acid-binding Zn-ribbon protein [Salinibacter ruber]MCS4050438.1 putative nucleic acid-binding Zn-ribbon protein [Salinibacter ruber]MCS4149571.1 putative nucleic acid-binding Zn-ribbon protein [Salinibacter ruber]
MTDDEFQRLKETEKRHLRAKKRLQTTLDQLKQQEEVQGVVRRMTQGARRLLAETESLVDRLRGAVAEQEARFEVALDDEWEEDEGFREAEEALRDERAEQLVRRMKAEETESSTRPGAAPGADDLSASGAKEEAAEADEPHPEGPDKTIGRMGDLRADDAS